MEAIMSSHIQNVTATLWSHEVTAAGVSNNNNRGRNLIFYFMRKGHTQNSQSWCQNNEIKCVFILYDLLHMYISCSEWCVINGVTVTLKGTLHQPQQSSTTQQIAWCTFMESTTNTHTLTHTHKQTGPRILDIQYEEWWTKNTLI